MISYNLSQDHRHRKVEYCAADNTDRHCSHQQAVEQHVSVLFIAAGSEDQAAAGREGADRAGLCTEDRACKQSDGAQTAGGGQGLVFTYYSSRRYFHDAVFLSIGDDAPSIELVVALSPGRYHSKAALELKKVLFDVLGK
jgi:hypothetical protein